MSTGLRVFLRILQLLSLAAALLFTVFSFLMTYADFGGTAYEEQFVGTWIIGFGVLSVALSPTLWSQPGGGPAAAAPSSTGSYDRVAEQPSAAPQPPRQAGVGFDPMSGNQAPAPPASSYGQQSGGFGGAPPQAGGMAPASPPQGETPWGNR
ncbi:hypothetical protein GCM10027447_10360 [Glycomyces halotolerans]